jgi:hypothetical protein
MAEALLTFRSCRPVRKKGGLPLALAGRCRSKLNVAIEGLALETPRYQSRHCTARRSDWHNTLEKRPRPISPLFL